MPHGGQAEWFALPPLSNLLPRIFSNFSHRDKRSTSQQVEKAHSQWNGKKNLFWLQTWQHHCMLLFGDFLNWTFRKDEVLFSCWNCGILLVILGLVILPDLLVHTRERASGHWGHVVKALDSFLVRSWGGVYFLNKYLMSFLILLFSTWHFKSIYLENTLGKYIFIFLNKISFITANTYGNSMFITFLIWAKWGFTKSNDISLKWALC